MITDFVVQPWWKGTLCDFEEDPLDDWASYVEDMAALAADRKVLRREVPKATPQFPAVRATPGAEGDLRGGGGEPRKDGKKKKQAAKLERRKRSRNQRGQVAGTSATSWMRAQRMENKRAEGDCPSGSTSNVVFQHTKEAAGRSYDRHLQGEEVLSSDDDADESDNSAKDLPYSFPNPWAQRLKNDNWELLATERVVDVPLWFDKHVRFYVMSSCTSN